MVYFGTDYLKSAIQFLGENIVGVLTTIGGMLPAVGIALTLKSIFKGDTFCYILRFNKAFELKIGFHILLFSL